MMNLQSARSYRTVARWVLVVSPLVLTACAGPWRGAPALDAVPGTVAAVPANALEMAEQRGRIARQYAALEQGLAFAERACYARFAVNDCLLEARQTYRAQRDALRREEQVLNDVDRRTRTLDARQRVAPP